MYRKALQCKSSRSIDPYANHLHHQGTSKFGEPTLSESLHGDMSFSRNSLRALHTRSYFVDILSCNSLLKKLTTLQKNHLEAIIESPKNIHSGSPLWSIGQELTNAYIVVSGTLKFASYRSLKRRTFVSVYPYVSRYVYEAHDLLLLGKSS